ncbi:MAG: TerB family tellurite resistance protein [Proteobacteria bacterium]|nr:TerB family tellurite resistance protein [Pseudomonadota bacterium]MCP4921470.1 TerB family tellurite resistance protein [Pseudomonadota bacterium]
MSESLDTLAARILDDGVIDADEVAEIRTRIYEDGIIDREEADFLFRLNDEKKSSCPEWQELFVEALAAHVADAGSTMSGAMTDWLADAIEGDGQVDEIERSLLVRLSDEGMTLPERLGRLL